MASAVTRKTGTRGGFAQRNPNTGRFRNGATGGAERSDGNGPGLAAVLQQVNDAVRTAYQTGRPMKLTVLLQGGSPQVEIGAEPLDPETSAALDLEAEQALLGALLYDNDGFESLGPTLTGEDFSEPFHQRLFAAMWEARQMGQIVEPILMAQRFDKDPALAELGGIRYLADLVDRAPPTWNVPAFAARVGGLAMQRRAQTDEDDLDVALKEARARGETRAAEVLAGPEMLGADDFARLIGATRETVRQKLRRHEVLGLQGAKRGVRYPAWQVTEDGGLLPGLPKLFELIGDSPWAVFRFLSQPTSAFGGGAPKDRLRAGEVDQVLDLAKSQARGDFG